MANPIEYEVPHRGLTWLQWYAPHNTYHPGVDLNRGVGNDDLGDPVVAPVGATVEYVSPDPTQWNDHNGGFGWFVVLHHTAHGKWSRLAHLRDVTVAQGDVVQEGELVGHVGNTGTKWAHLHWEVWTPTGHAAQLAAAKPYRMYPTGWRRARIQEHYVDPLAWLAELPKQPNWKQDAETWAARYAQDVPGLLHALGPDAHRVIEFIRKVKENETTT